MANDPLALSLRQVKVAYGGIQAVKGIDLELAAGELVCLIGANGAGKTTTLNAIAGVLPLSGGEIRYLGQAIHKLPIHQRLRRGIALVPEGRGIFTRLTVEENLRMGAYTRRDKGAVESDLERVFAMLPRIKERLAQVAGTLSGGEQQMVAIGRALMTAPRLILLDEPSLGLSPRLVTLIFDKLQEMKRAGYTLMVVEQNAAKALSVADRGYVLELGENRFEGSGQALLSDPDVKRLYLGG